MGNIAELYELLGVDMPPETGENEPEPADPAETGEREQEVTDPAADPTGNDPADPDPAEPQASPTQTKEQRAAQAQKRRAAAQQAAVEAAVQAEREKHAAELKALFAKSNLTDPATGKPIETMEQFNAWHQSAQMAEAQKALKAGKLTPENMEQLIENSPTMQRARQQLEQTEAAAKQARSERHQQLLQNELAEIRKLNPKIESLNDILAMETGPEWAKLVNENGLSYIQAYRLANQDALLAQASRAAATGAQIQSRGKQHLRPDAVLGRTGAEVPRNVLDLYRIFRPDLTEDQIQQDYLKRSAAGS